MNMNHDLMRGRRPGTRTNWIAIGTLQEDARRGQDGAVEQDPHPEVEEGAAPGRWCSGVWGRSGA